MSIIEAYNVLEADGVICARQGSGYFVNTQPLVSANLKPTFAPEQEVIIKEPGGNSFFDMHMARVQAQAQPGMIDMSFGFPRPPKNLMQISKRALKQVDVLSQYDLPQGQLILRRQIAQMLVHQGLDVSSEDLIIRHLRKLISNPCAVRVNVSFLERSITNGSEQALSLAMSHFVQRGDWVIVEAPTYYGAIAILENLGAKIIGIPMKAEGMNLELLEQYLKSHRPKLIYTITTLHNPTGLTTTQAHRQKLLALAEQYECPILEDNAYEGLNFEPVPALRG